MERYKDIIHLQYPKSNAYPRRPMSERACQFSPFAALTGYDEAIEEEARLTDSRVLLSEDEKKELGEKLRFLKENIEKTPEVCVSFFVPDEKKRGGRYLIAKGKIRKIKDYEQELLMESGETIGFCDILYIDCDLFRMPDA